MKTEIFVRGFVVVPLMIIALFCSHVSEQIGNHPLVAETVAFYALVLTIVTVAVITLGAVLLLLVFQGFCPTASLDDVFDFFDTIAELLTGRPSEKAESILLYVTILLVGVGGESLSAQ